jgi:hypothetical protein
MQSADAHNVKFRNSPIVKTNPQGGDSRTFGHHANHALRHSREMRANTTVDVNESRRLETRVIVTSRLQSVCNRRSPLVDLGEGGQQIRVDHRRFERRIDVEVGDLAATSDAGQSLADPGDRYRQFRVMGRQRVPEEVVMQESLACRYTRLGVVDEKPGQQVDGRRRRVGHQLVERHAGELGKRDLVVVGQTGQPGPRRLVGRAEDAQHAAQLLDVVVAGKQRRIVEQLAEDAPDCPQVDAFVVATSAV